MFKVRMSRRKTKLLSRGEKVNFTVSKEMNVSVFPEQERNLSSKERIRMLCQREDVLSFDIILEGKIIGFAMLRQFDRNSFFLWNYAVDFSVQGQGFGKRALKDLIEFMREHYEMNVMTTTYIYGNKVAERLYRSIGFEEIGVVEEEGCHEVNMLLDLSSEKGYLKD